MYIMSQSLLHGIAAPKTIGSASEVCRMVAAHTNINGQLVTSLHHPLWTASGIRPGKLCYFVSFVSQYTDRAGNILRHEKTTPKLYLLPIFY